jgi:fructoselysine-6-P-deglycase FrlB-like protein
MQYVPISEPGVFRHNVTISRRKEPSRMATEQTTPGTSRTAAEIATQPDLWRRAARLAPRVPGLPARGERVAVTGCGTSWFMAQAYAALREAAGQGETDAFAASEFPRGRSYARVIALTRSGTTTEVLELLAALRGRIPTTALTAAPGTAVTTAADTLVALDWADEESVAQPLFAPTAFALLRARLEADGPRAAGVAPLAEAAEECGLALSDPLPAAALTAAQITFLGSGWAYGLAQEAALKMREAAGAWTEAYPAPEYRHGPIAIAAPGRVAWAFGPLPAGLAAALSPTGATLLTSPLDPLADLVRVQRLAVATAHTRGHDPDRPRHLTRSVILR